MKMTSTIFLDFLRHVLDIQETDDIEVAKVVLTLCKEVRLTDIEVEDDPQR